MAAKKKKKSVVKKAKALPKKASVKKKKAPARKPAAKKTKKRAAKKAAAPTKKAAAAKKKTAAPKKAAPKASPKKASPKKAPAFSFDIIDQVEHFSASPELIYRAWLDSAGHSAFTLSEAKVDARVGGLFTAYDGYISGVTTELVENERIVQRWRATDFPGGYPDSKLELTLTPESGGTRLRLRHSSVPTKNAKSYESGWHDHYWQPLRAYIAGLPSA